MHRFCLGIVGEAEKRLTEEPEIFDRDRTGMDLIKHFLHSMLTRSIIPTEHTRQKDETNSVRYTAHANILFDYLRRYFGKAIANNAPSCVEAHMFYNKSVAFAPRQSQRLALAYAARTRFLFDVKMYKPCMEDIRRALALPCPDNVRLMLYNRRVECLNALGYPGIKNLIEDTCCSLQQMSLDTYATQGLIERLDTLRVEENLSEQNDLEEPMLPGGSSRNEANNSINETSGRSDGVEQPKEEFFAQAALSSALPVEKIYLNCSHCLEKTWASIACDYCTSAMYCSEGCKTKNWEKYHDIECSVFTFVWNIKPKLSNIYASALRFAIDVVKNPEKMEKLKKIVSENDFRKTEPFEIGIPTCNESGKMVDLGRSPEERRILLALHSSIILYYLATGTNLFGDPLEIDLLALTNNNDVLFIGSILMVQIQTLARNHVPVTPINNSFIPKDPSVGHSGMNILISQEFIVSYRFRQNNCACAGCRPVEMKQSRGPMRHPLRQRARKDKDLLKKRT